MFQLHLTTTTLLAPHQISILSAHTRYNCVKTDWRLPGVMNYQKISMPIQGKRIVAMARIIHIPHAIYHWGSTTIETPLSQSLTTIRGQR